MVTLITAVLGAGFLLHGVQGALAGAGMTGKPGIVTVTTCSSSRFGESCSGTFTWVHDQSYTIGRVTESRPWAQVQHTERRES